MKWHILIWFALFVAVSLSFPHEQPTKVNGDVTAISQWLACHPDVVRARDKILYPPERF